MNVLKVGDVVQIADEWRNIHPDATTSILEVVQLVGATNFIGKTIYADSNITAVNSFVKGRIELGGFIKEAWGHYKLKEGDIVESNDSLSHSYKFKLLLLEDERADDFEDIVFKAKCIESNNDSIITVDKIKNNFSRQYFDLHTCHLENSEKTVPFKKGDLVSSISDERWKLILVTANVYNFVNTFSGVVIKAEHDDETIRPGFLSTAWIIKDFELANVELIPKLKSNEV